MKKCLIFCLLLVFSLTSKASWCTPLSGGSPVLSGTTITLESDKDIYEINDIVRVGMDVVAPDMAQMASFYLRFNTANNGYTDIQNQFLTVDGAFDDFVPVVGDMFPLEYYNLNCLEANSSSPCLMEFPASLIGPGTYSFTAFLADPNDVNNTLIESNELVFDVAQAQQCGVMSQSGADNPGTYVVDMGTTNGEFTFSYDTMNIKDRILILYENTVIFDTECVGTSGMTDAQVGFSGNSTKITVKVEPNCEGGSGTLWEFTVGCPQ